MNYFLVDFFLLMITKKVVKNIIFLFSLYYNYVDLYDLSKKKKMLTCMDKFVFKAI